MTLLMLEGCEGTTTINDLLQRGWSALSVSGGSIQAGAARSGARGIASGTTTLTWTAETADRHARMAIGAAFQRTASASFTLQLRDTANTVVAQVSVTNTATVTVTVLGTLRATVSYAAAGVVDLAWNYLEFECFANASTGTVRVQVNGVAIAGLNWDGNTGSNLLASAIVTANGYWIDDIYILNGAGSAPWNAMLGDVAVVPIYPNGAGTSTQFTASGAATNWQAVSETDRSTSQIVSSSTVGHRDLYALGDLPANAATVLGLRVLGYWSKSDAGARTGALPVRSGGTTNSGAAYGLPTSYGYNLRLLPVNPVTGVQWTVSEVNALEAGVEVVS